MNAGRGALVDPCHKILVLVIFATATLKPHAVLCRHNANRSRGTSWIAHLSLSFNGRTRASGTSLLVITVSHRCHMPLPNSPFAFLPILSSYHRTKHGCMQLLHAD